MFEIIHRPAIKFPYVDAMSRVPAEVSLDELSVFTIVTPIDEITMYQYADDKLKRKLEILQKS